MKLLYEGQVVTEIITNRSLTIDEALYAYGLDVKSQSDIDKAFDHGAVFIYRDDMGRCQIDYDGLEMEY